MNIFTPKALIFKAIKGKLEGTGIIKVILYFNVKEDAYNIMVGKKDGSGIKLEIGDNEISMLKKMFISKIVKKYKEDNSKEIYAIILQMKFETEEIKIFIEDKDKNVELFNY